MRSGIVAVLVEAGLAVAVVAVMAHAVVTKVGVATLVEPEADAVAALPDPDDRDDEDTPSKKKKKKGGFDFGSDDPFGGAGKVKQRIASLLAYDPFCPVCRPPPGMEGEGPGNVGASSLPLVLVATMEAVDPSRSLATVFDPDTETVGVYGIGDTIRPGVVLAGVERTRVLLNRGGNIEALLLGADRGSSRKKSKKSSKEKKKKRKKSKAYIEGSEEAIDCPSESLCIVDRAFVEKLLANPAALAKQARVVPKKKDGEQVGLRFYGIRRDSLPRMLGLKNGDMLVSVNGEELTSMDKVMNLYMKLRNASNLQVVIDRKGKRISKEIQIK